MTLQEKIERFKADMAPTAKRLAKVEMRTTVAQLIELLKREDPSAYVLVSSDEEGNQVSHLQGVGRDDDAITFYPNH